MLIILGLFHIYLQINIIITTVVAESLELQVIKLSPVNICFKLTCKVYGKAILLTSTS